MSLNVYKNCAYKLRALLSSDSALKASECDQMQWQLLYKVPNCEWNFVIGKGGVNTIFYSNSSLERNVCYPEDAKELLANLSKTEVFCYKALDKKKIVLGYFLLEKEALNCKNARYVASVSFKGKTTTLWKKQKDLFGKKQWEPT